MWNRLKLYTPLLVFTLLGTISHPAYSTEHDDFILTFVTSVIPAALKRTSESEVFYCKKNERQSQFRERLHCGTSVSNVQYSYFVLYIDKGQIVADAPPLVLHYQGAYLEDDHCGPNASIIGPEKIGQGDIPEDAIPAADLQADIDEKKAEGKIPIFYKITVKNGNNNWFDILLNPYCEKK